MDQLQITLTERMKMILIELFIDNDDGDSNDDGAGGDDGNGDYNGDDNDDGDDNDNDDGDFRMIALNSL